MADSKNQTINLGDDGHQNQDSINSQGGKRKKEDNSGTNTDRNNDEEGGEINRNINETIPTTKTHTEATYDTYKEGSVNGENSSNTAELKKKRKDIQTPEEMELDSNVATASSTSVSNTSHTYSDRNAAKEGGEINRNINEAFPTTKTPTEDTYDTDKEENVNGENSSNTAEQKKKEESHSNSGRNGIGVERSHG